jgi:hypothetical protein
MLFENAYVRVALTVAFFRSLSAVVIHVGVLTWMWCASHFRFSLRTLLALVTVFCVGIAWEIHAVQERKKTLVGLNARGAAFYLPDVDEPISPAQWLRQRVFFDIHVVSLVAPKSDIDDAEAQKLSSLFPEAHLARPRVGWR